MKNSLWRLNNFKDRSAQVNDNVRQQRKVTLIGQISRPIHYTECLTEWLCEVARHREIPKP
jgi:hypothetical protein